MIEFSDTVLEKARKLSDDDVRQDQTYPDIWWVTGSGLDVYRVQLGKDDNGVLWYVTCTCPHGLNTGAGEASCYHVCSVLLRLKERES